MRDLPDVFADLARLAAPRLAAAGGRAGTATAQLELLDCWVHHHRTLGAQLKAKIGAISKALDCLADAEAASMQLVCRTHALELDPWPDD